MNVERKETHIYTKGGDKGRTSLANGMRVKKHDARVEAYGTIDELNSHVGMLAAMLAKEKLTKDVLHDIQRRLFDVGNILAESADSEASDERLNAAVLEEEINEMGKEAGGEFAGFVLPGGHESAAQAHICRSVCRRAERKIWLLMEESGETGKYESAAVYMNRLSDYFYVLAKKLNIFFEVKEIKY